MTMIVEAENEITSPLQEELLQIFTYKLSGRVFYLLRAAVHQVPDNISQVVDGVALSFKVAPYSYLKFWVFYATFGLAKFTTNTLNTRQSDYFEDIRNV